MGSILRISAFVVSALMTTVPSLGDQPGASRAISEAKEVIAIYAEDWGLASGGAPGLIAALWEDGRVVWSMDQIHGGPPYRQGQLQPDAVVTFLTKLKRDGVFHDPGLARAWMAWDSKFTTILLRRKGRELRMRSGHEVEGTGHGDFASPDYQSFLQTWNEVRSYVATLLPAQSTPVDGELISERGVLTWRMRE